MNNDICVASDDNLVNIRVGAIIIKDNKVLMMGNEKVDYLYTVGGRIKFGETSWDAVVREVFEETGVKMEVDRLGFVHENLFPGDSYFKQNKFVYEIAFYFYMKVPSDFCEISQNQTEDNAKECLHWVDLDEIEKCKKLYPAFFKTELKHPTKEVKYFLTDDRNKK